MHINPDHYLETEAGRVITHDRNNDAWKQSYRALHQALANAAPDTKVYVLVGAQGAGKSTWAREFARQNPRAIIFDAILVKNRERTPILAAAEARGVKAVAVWFRTPLEACLERNAAREADEVVPDQGVKNVFAAIEPPSTSEGFEQVIEVHAFNAEV
jgi:predicted kinase